MGSFQALLREIRSGDDQSLNDLLAMWRPFLCRNAHGRIGASVAARADTSDIVQNALLQVAEDVTGFRGNTEGEWVAWLRAILSGQAGKINRFHHCSKRTVALEQVASESTPPIPGTSVAHDLDTAALEELCAAIDCLPPTMKEVIHRRIFEKQSYDVISKEMQISNGHARVLLTRAIRSLKEQLESE